MHSCAGIRQTWLAGVVLAAGLLGGGASAQIIVTNFSGVSLSDTYGLGTGATPPDSMGAAGPNQFVEFVNGAFAIYSKAGVRQSLISDNAFWLNAGITSSVLSAGISDPRIAFDAASGRWFATEITVDTVGNQILLGRSDTSDPAGAWRALHFTAYTGFGDYDALGVDAHAVYISVNNFTDGTTSGEFTNVSLFSIPKVDLLAGTPTLANMTRFDNLNDQVYGFALQGVNSTNAGTSHGVILAIDNAAYNYFDRTTISNPGAAGATLAAPVRIYSAYDGGPNPAEQPGGQTIDALDDRFSAAVRQVGGNIFLANTVLQGSRDAVHWIVLRESDNTILGEGIVSDISYDYFQPSIAANGRGQFVMTFNRSGSTAPAGDISIYGLTGSISNTTVTVGSPFLIRQGTISNFYISFGGTPNRWGDFSATMADPVDDHLFWSIQEIPVSSTAWGTQITLISLDTNRPSLSITPSGTNQMVSWPLRTDPAYRLWATTNLLSPVTWTAVTNPAAISGAQNEVAVLPTNSAWFFQLQK